MNDSDSEAAVTPEFLKTGATDGNFAMHLGAYHKLSRSIPQVTVGEVQFDLYVESLGGFTFELQSAYNADAGISAPITLFADANGRLSYLNENGNRTTTSLYLSKGNNSIAIAFDGKGETACLTVNGSSAEIDFRSSLGNYVCFAYLYTQSGTSVSMDRFTVLDFD